MRASECGLPKSKQPSFSASASCSSSNRATFGPSVFRRPYPRVWGGLRARAARCSTRSMSGGTAGWREVKIKSPSFSNWKVFPFTVHDSNMMDYAINEASFGLTVAGCDR